MDWLNQYREGGMIKRADGSYSQRGLWDNIRGNVGSGKKPTKQMLQQEKKIKAAEHKQLGGYSTTGYKADSPDRNNPYNLIPTGRITMQNVPYPVIGMDNYGNHQYMLPGGEYQFPGQQVFEVPVMKEGGFVKMQGGWLQQYQQGGFTPSQSAALRQAQTSAPVSPYQDMDPTMLQGYQQMQQVKENLKTLTPEQMALNKNYADYKKKGESKITSTKKRSPKEEREYQAAKANAYEQMNLDSEGNTKPLTVLARNPEFNSLAEKINDVTAIMGATELAYGLGKTGIEGANNWLSKLKKAPLKPVYGESNVVPHYPYSFIEPIQPIRTSGNFPAASIGKAKTPTGMPTLVSIPELNKEQQILESFGLNPNNVGKIEPLTTAAKRRIWDKQIEVPPSEYTALPYNRNEPLGRMFLTKGPNSKGELFEQGYKLRSGETQHLVNREHAPWTDVGIDRSPEHLKYEFPNQYTDFGIKTPFQRMINAEKGKTNQIPDQLLPTIRQQNKYGGKTGWLNKYK